ncbi:MAG: hypothetical protein Q6373_021860 [Candidatus Sigynarchaeota archaeon]
MLDFTLGLVLLFKTIKLAPSPPRRYYKGVVFFFFTHSVCRTVFFVRGYFIEKTNNATRVPMFDIGTILGLLSVLFLVFVIETTIVTQTRKIFTIMGFCALGIMVLDFFIRLTVNGRRLLLTVQNIAIPILAAFIIAVYLRALLKSTGRVRTNAMVMLIAIVLLALSELANSDIAGNLLGRDLARYLGPSVMAAALILLYYAVTNLSIWKKEKISENEPAPSNPRE